MGNVIFDGHDLRDYGIGLSGGGTWAAPSRNVKKATIPYLNYTYKGSRITPPVTVKDTLGNKLVNGRDFTAFYSNDLNVGTAKITVKGKGNYQGSISRTFNITPNDLADNRVTIPALSYIYVGEPVTPKPTLKFNDI